MEKSSVRVKSLAVNESFTCWRCLERCTASGSHSYKPADQPASSLQALRILCQHLHSLGPLFIPSIVSLGDFQSARVWAYVCICVLIYDFVCVIECVCVRARLNTHVSSWLFATAGNLGLSADDGGKADTFSPCLHYTHIHTSFPLPHLFTDSRKTHTGSHTVHCPCPFISWTPRTMHKPVCHFFLLNIVSDNSHQCCIKCVHIWIVVIVLSCRHNCSYYSRHWALSNISVNLGDLKIWGWVYIQIHIH